MTDKINWLELESKFINIWINEVGGIPKLVAIKDNLKDASCMLCCGVSLALKNFVSMILWFDKVWQK